MVLPSPRPSRPRPLFHSTTKDDVWVYTTEKGESTRIIVREATDVSGSRLEIHSFVKGVLVDKDEILVSEDGIYRMQSGSNKLLLCFFRPYTSAWVNRSSEGGSVFQAEYTSGKLEDIDTPMGRLHAMKVESRYRFDDLGIEGYLTEWYVAGIGLAKRVDNRGGEQSTTILQRFERGK
jgi:hypothetical protein